MTWDLTLANDLLSTLVPILLAFTGTGLGIGALVLAARSGLLALRK